jgi:NAD(P)-dependent dehydrogenase (short-subunit alcohol dehydrogenase family)
MKNYLIIGASSGIGEAIVHSLEKEGNVIYATYKNNKKESSSSSTHFHYLNVRDQELNLDFLPEVLDGVVYCPGAINLKPFERIKPGAFADDYELQVLGAVKVLQKLMPRLKKSENASVVLFSTVAVQVGLPFHSLVSASKGAIEGLTKALAAEYAPKVRVNCVAPSLTDTPLAAALLSSPEKKESNAARHPMKRIGTAEDIADMVCFLLSEKSTWITGQVFHVDGGISTIK